MLSPELKGCVTWFIYFLDLLWVRNNCAKFHHCRIRVADFREGGTFLPPPHPWAAHKKPIPNRVKRIIDVTSYIDIIWYYASFLRKSTVGIFHTPVFCKLHLLTFSCFPDPSPCLLAPFPLHCQKKISHSIKQLNCHLQNSTRNNPFYKFPYSMIWKRMSDF